MVSDIREVLNKAVELQADGYSNTSKLSQAEQLLRQIVNTDSFHQMVDEDPVLAEAYQWLTIVIARQGRTTEAYDLAKFGVQQHPENEKIANSFASATSFRVKDFDPNKTEELKAFLKREIEDMPNDRTKNYLEAFIHH